MKILVINCGSSSIKYKLYDMSSSKVLAAGGMEKIGLDRPFLKMRCAGGQSRSADVQVSNHEEGMRLILAALADPAQGAIKSFSEIDAVGHRVVHGGKSARSVVATPEAIRNLEEYSELAPLHNPAALKGYRAVCKNLPGVKQVFVYDTAFHQTIPDYASTYALPYEICEKYKIRRYGFHGTSHRYVLQRAAEFLGWDVTAKKIITCHIGNGASMTAIDGGKAVDTTMGLTPLEGLVMGTRCGDIDPSIITFLMERMKLSPQEMTGILNKKSGVLGISGVSSDMRELDKAMSGGDRRAALAYEVYCYRIRKYIGAYAFAMGGVDAIIFTAGVGEHQASVRSDTLRGLEGFGIRIDPAKNSANSGADEVISADGSRVTVAVIGTDEELLIARDTAELVSRG